MATNDISDEAIFRATGSPWKHWLEVFSLMDAKELPHKEIARKLTEVYKVPGWWSQMLTVRFEQEIGRRQPGDSKNGITVGVSATIDGYLDTLYAHWKKIVGTMESFQDVAQAEPPTLSQTENWRYWKLKLADGTRVYVNFSQKSEGKVLVQITHEKLSDESQMEPWKAYWKSILADVFK